MEKTLQHQTTTQCSGLLPTGCANHRPNGIQADRVLTLKPIHLGGADQVLTSDTEDRDDGYFLVNGFTRVYIVNASNYHNHFHELNQHEPKGQYQGGHMTEGQIFFIIVAILIIFTISRGLRIVPQADKWVIERFGKYRRVLGPGINLLVPFIDKVAHKVTVLERQLPNASQDAITADNVLVDLETSVFYRIISPEKTVYRIRDVDSAIATTVAGIVRSEVGRIELDAVQSNRATLINQIKQEIVDAVDEWGIEVTRAELLDVNLDEATREAMLQQLNAERARRADVTRAEGEKRAVELRADAALYEASKQAEARRIEADAEAYATEAVARAIADNGAAAAQYQVALKQVDALNQLGAGESKSTIILPASALDAFANAFKLFKKD